MSIYVIDKYHKIKIHSNYFNFFSEKIFFKIEKFTPLSANKKFEVLLFTYDLDDLYTFFEILNNDFHKIKIVVINIYLLKLLKRTKNINYIYIYDFYKNIKTFRTNTSSNS